MGFESSDTMTDNLTENEKAILILMEAHVNQQLHKIMFLDATRFIKIEEKLKKLEEEIEKLKRADKAF